MLKALPIVKLGIVTNSSRASCAFIGDVAVALDYPKIISALAVFV